ncbi:MAG TPA: GNAT family N-acetyltransferase [Pirellulales bacterium]|nr:GNAT family N-acetyltransferase [Pirellulales bacterium]
MQPLSVDLLDSLVFAKPYFEREGLIVAVDGELPVGFAHGSFGPCEREVDISTQWGVVSLVMVRPNYQRQGIGAELVRRCEEYLRGRGAKVLYAGGIKPLNAFYLGLYGGSELPGVLDSGPRAQQLFRASGYREIDRTIVFHRELAGFRAPMDRQQIQIRRRCTLRVINDPPPRTRWEACIWGPFDRTRFELVENVGGAVVASAMFWNLQPLASSWGVHAAGLTDLEVNTEHRRGGLATYLLGESFRHCSIQGASLVEVQTMLSNTAARQLYTKLGFKEVDQGAVFRKDESAPT